LGGEKLPGKGVSFPQAGKRGDLCQPLLLSGRRRRALASHKKKAAAPPPYEEDDSPTGGRLSLKTERGFYLDRKRGSNTGSKKKGEYFRRRRIPPRGKYALLLQDSSSFWEEIPLESPGVKAQLPLSSKESYPWFVREKGEGRCSSSPFLKGS